MPRFTQPDIPIRHVEVSGIERLHKEILDALMPDFTARQALRKKRLAFKKALHFDLGFKPTGGKTFERFFQYAGKGLNAHEHFPLASRFFVLESERRPEHPVSVEKTRAHPVECLFRILSAVMLADCCENKLLKLAIGILSKFEGGRLQYTSNHADSGPQLNMSFHAAGQPRYIIDYYSIPITFIFLQKGQHRLHARSFDYTPGKVVAKYAFHGIIPVLCILTTSCFLRTKAIAAFGLRSA